LKKFDTLYEKIQKEYKTSYQLDDTGFLEEICVCIGRDGDILFGNSGWHRLAMARISALDRIPVRVMLRHRKWQEVREQFFKYISKDEPLPNELKSYVNHPDLIDIIGDSSLRSQARCI